MVLTTLGICFLMSLFCCGLFVSMQDGQLLSFMRQPFIDMMEHSNKDHKEMLTELKNKYSLDKEKVIKEFCNEAQQEIELEKLRDSYNNSVTAWNNHHKNDMYRFNLLKPFVICVWCFASFWGSLVFWSWHYFYIGDCSRELIPMWIISVFICVVFNAVIDAILNKIGVY